MFCLQPPRPAMLPPPICRTKEKCHVFGQPFPYVVHWYHASPSASAGNSCYISWFLYCFVLHTPVSHIMRDDLHPFLSLRFLYLHLRISGTALRIILIAYVCVCVCVYNIKPCLHVVR